MRTHFTRPLLVAYALCQLALGAQGQAIVLGSTLPLSGVAGDVGKEWLRGANACAQQVNLDGGVGGKPLKIVSKDDGGDPLKAVRNAAELVDDGRAVALLGGMGTTTLSELLAWANTRALVVLGPDSGLLSAQVSKYETAYFLTANSALEAERLVEHMTTLGTKRVMVLYSRDTEGQYALTAVEQALTVQGITPARIEPLVQGMTARRLTEDIALSDAQAIVLAASPRHSADALRLLSAVEGGGKLLSQVYALSDTVTELQFRQLGASVRSLVLSQVTPRPDDPARRVSAYYLRALGTTGGADEPTYTGFRACIAVMVFAEVMKRANQPASRQGVLAAFKAARYIDLGGWSVDLSDRQVPGSRFVDITLLSSGRRPVR